MNNILKTDSFVKHEKIYISDKLIFKENEKGKINESKNKKDKNIQKKIINLPNNNGIISLLDHQNYILNILMELRDFDDKNGSNLFKNISYNNLNNFILKNNF
jgi:hypothetical protein